MCVRLQRVGRRGERSSSGEDKLHQCEDLEFSLEGSVTHSSSCPEKSEVLRQRITN